jgi:hypothetical protein
VTRPASILKPAHLLLQEALVELGGLDAPDPKPSTVAEHDAGTETLAEIRSQLEAALMAVGEMERHRAIEREDLAYAIKEAAARESMSEEAWLGVSRQFTPRG